MYPPDEFLKHADDCQRMAKVARDPTTKATWRQMSQRWVQCAERGQGRGCHREQCRLVETTSHEQANWARLGGLEHGTKSSRSRHQTLKHYWAPALGSSAPSCCTVLSPWRDRDELEALRALARAGRTVEYALGAMPQWIET
jgi:hypothetical protein